MKGDNQTKASIFVPAKAVKSLEAVSKELNLLNGLLIQIWKGLDVPERLILSK